MITTGDPRASGLCGWFGPFASDLPPQQALAGMAAALAPGPGTTSHPASHATAQAALHVAPGSNAGALAAEAGIVAAIDGYPSWSVPELAEVARTRGHAAALIVAYRNHGEGLLQHLHGPFALALLDPDNRRALLAVDRLGIQPLCFADSAGTVVFGSSTTAVARHPAVTATVSPQAVLNFLAFYRIFAPQTIYAEQRKLLPAQYLLIDGDKRHTGFYWQMPYAADDGLSATAREAALFDRLRAGVRTCTEGVAHERIGAFLSGGLDSSTVTGFLSEISDPPAKAFTIGFDCEGYDETEFARAAAKQFGVEHHVYTVRPADVVDFFPRIAEMFDEPFGNSSALPTYYCARLAREHGVEVLLAGDGGDELFAGNAIYGLMQKFETYSRLPSLVRHGVIEPIAFGLPERLRPSLVAKAGRYINYANRPMPARSVENELHLAQVVSQSLTRALGVDIDADQPVAVLREVYERSRGRTVVQRMMHMDLQTVLADNDLRKVNRACAYGGIRVRYPMLDEGVVELAARVPPGQQLKGTRLRHFYRRAMQDYLPPMVLQKRKHGFGLPYVQWFKDHPPLRELTHEAMIAARRRGLLDAGFIDEVSAAHARNDESSLIGPIWDIAVLELWLQNNVDRRHTQPVVEPVA